MGRSRCVGLGGGEARVWSKADVWGWVGAKPVCGAKPHTTPFPTQNTQHPSPHKTHNTLPHTKHTKHTIPLPTQTPNPHNSSNPNPWKATPPTLPHPLPHPIESPKCCLRPNTTRNPSDQKAVLCTWKKSCLQFLNAGFSHVSPPPLSTYHVEDRRKIALLHFEFF